MNEQNMITKTAVNTEALQAIINYLETRPHKEVTKLLSDLVNGGIVNVNIPVDNKTE